MTAPRPGGKTARGLRYPGNDITVDEIPDAIRNLANDIDTALGTAGASQMTVQQISYAVQLNGAGNGYNPSSPVTFGNLASVTGCVANYAQDGFSAGLLLQISGNVVTVVAPMTSGIPMNPPVAPPNTGTPVGTYAPQHLGGRSVVVDFIAWGPKK